jgi:hypothetical protein
LTGFYFKKKLFQKFYIFTNAKYKNKNGDSGERKETRNPPQFPGGRKGKKNHRGKFPALKSYLILALAHHHLDPHMRNP